MNAQAPAATAARSTITGVAIAADGGWTAH
jgi:hypothetical protein